MTSIKMRESILLNLEVVRTTRYYGDVNSAIDEAYELSKELKMGCRLNYVDQYVFTILPTMTQEEIEELKNRKLVIGL